MLSALHFHGQGSAETTVLGRGVYDGKNIQRVYRIVPVHQQDCHLLGMQWRGSLCIDMALPFGLRSAPKIFNAVADRLQWILNEQCMDTLHYLDYFFGWRHVTS